MPQSYAVGFDVQVDRQLRLLTVTLSGVPSAEDIGWIAEEVRAAVLALGADAGQHHTLYDARGVQVLPQATADFVVQNFSDPGAAPRPARRLAFVASTVLTRRQIRRIVKVRPGAAMFDDIDAARAWLLADG